MNGIAPEIELSVKKEILALWLLLLKFVTEFFKNLYWYIYILLIFRMKEKNEIFKVAAYTKGKVEC